MSATPPSARPDLGHLLSWLAWRATRVEWPPWKNALIDWVVRRYGVDLDEARDPDPHAYPSFNAFFTRELRDGARPLDPRPDALLSPADGVVAARGRVDDGRLLQAKGIDYSLSELLGGDHDTTAAFGGAAYLTVYLSPRDYHRVHMPVAGRLRQMVYLPGRLRSVRPRCVEHIPGLFSSNERVVSLFDTDHGPLAMVLVGATMVGGVSQVWCGSVMPPRARRAGFRDYRDDGPALARGAEMGRFEMGSTVIALLANPHLRWDADARIGARVRVGQGLAVIDSD